ncbi:MAG: YihY/virulence factor BrkB family protein, partial [Clostridium sp.]|nr:YihY/virulence factor BrkB family protein [Clostridium sp.]
RKGLRNKGVSLLFTLFIVILIPAVLVFNFLGGVLTELVTSLAARFGFQHMTGLLVSVIRYSGIAVSAFAVLLLILLYTFLPGGKRKLRAQVPGALLTAAVWIIFTEVFSRVMPIFWKSSIYGSLASLFLTLLWLRVMITILFIGAAWNEAAAEEKEEVNSDTNNRK